MNAIRLGVPEVEYQADPAFSYSQAKVLLQSPARYKWQRDNGGRPDTAAFDFGHAVHAKVLGVGLDFWRIDADDWRTAAVRQQRDAARSYGFVPMLGKDLDAAQRLADSVLMHPGARRILETPGDVEASMWWTDKDTGVECRARIDFLAAHEDGLVNCDLKSAVDASPRAFSKIAANYLYHLQAAAYEDGLRHITGEECPSVLIVVEKEPPHLVALYEFPAEEIARGLDKWRDALDALVKYREADYWPGYPDSIQPLYLPPWA